MVVPAHVDMLLIGGGVASARCARALRRGGFGGSILLVGEEASLPYNRPPLSKELLSGDLPEALVLAEPASWYERRGIEVRSGTPVERLDPEGQATLADGTRISFGRALLATGAAPLRPPIPGAERLLLLRTLRDAIALRERAVAGDAAVVVGGGFIGVEVAASLAARGVKVTLLEAGDALWTGAFGTALSDWAVERLAAAGVSVRLRAPASGATDAGVLTPAGMLTADLALAGVGVAPRVELASAAGLHVDDGVLVDDGQVTSHPSVLAAGDVARQRDGVRVEHWHAAREGGERAAATLLGAAAGPQRTPWVFSEFADSTLDVFGLPALDHEMVEHRRADAIAAVSYVRGGSVEALAVLDGSLLVEMARGIVERRGTVAEVIAALG
jgi:NADPH-dependent 2,4-dienoyl-CoA reductase/sulfur reductase-like enzyme